MSDKPIGAILADIFSDPGKPASDWHGMSTEDVVASLLTQNTGRHVLDSGGAGGRAWERNAGMTVADFEARPECELTPYGYALIDVYHFLTANLDFDATMQDAFDTFANEEGRQSDSWFTLVEDFADSRHEKYGEIGTVYTYNHESALSQDIHYTYWQDSERDCYFVALAIHGGADARGGFTDPRIFTIAGDELGNLLFNDSDYYVSCSGYQREDVIVGQLDIFGNAVSEYDAVGCAVTWGHRGGDTSCVDKDGNETDLPEVDWNELTKDDDDNILCPICNRGTLEAWVSYDS